MVVQPSSKRWEARQHDEFPIRKCQVVCASHSRRLTATEVWATEAEVNFGREHPAWKKGRCGFRNAPGLLKSQAGNQCRARIPGGAFLWAGGGDSETAAP